MNPALEPWKDFNVAVAGASAALAGLLIVAMSVNVDAILAAPAVASRAGSAIGSLTLAVTAACLPLIPDQSVVVLGAEILVGGVICLFLALLAARQIYSSRTASPDPSLPPPPSHQQLSAKVAMNLAAPALFTVGGAILLADNASGLNWVAAGSSVSSIAGVVFAWIALVEIRR